LCEKNFHFALKVVFPQKIFDVIIMGINEDALFKEALQ